MATTLVPCPLGTSCITGATTGHEPKSQALADCQARADGKGRVAAGNAAFDPTRAYSNETDAMKRLHSRIKRAWGADGRGIPNLIGPPGIGKSEVVENMARAIGGDFLVFDVSANDPDILIGIPYNPTDDTVSEGGEVEGADGKPRVRIAGRLYEREIAEIFYRTGDKADKPLIVFFDEINGGKETMMSSLQKVMTSRTLSQEGVRMNDNVFMVAAMNDAEHTSNGNDLAAAMVSRLTPIEVKPNFDEWSNGELTFWGKGFDAERMERVAAALGERAPTQEQYLEAATTVIHYLDKMGNARRSSGHDDSTVNIFSEPLDPDDLTKKVGQPRSWSKVISGFASAKANPEPGSVDTEVYADIVKANCGARAARDFAAHFETHKDLPDISEALDKGTLGEVRKQWKNNGRSDIPMYAISVIANSRFEGGDTKRIGHALDLMGEIAEDFPDLAATHIPPMIGRWNQDYRDIYGHGSDEMKALVGVLHERLVTNQALHSAFDRRASDDYASGGVLDIVGAALSGAKSTAKREREAKQ